MTLIYSLICFYTGQILFKNIATEIKRRNLKVGDSCKVYIGERKIEGLVLKISQEIEIWVSNKVILAQRNQIYI